MTEKKTEALKLALEALREDRAWLESDAPDDIWAKNLYAITSATEALAEQCVCGEPDTPGTHRTDGPCLAEQPAQQQEPVALSQAVYTVLEGFTLPHDVRKILESAYYSDQPASKPWVGLTDEEIAEIEDGYIVDYRIPAGCGWNFAKDIEAKLREKNA